MPAAPVSPAGIRIESELRADRAASSARPRPPTPLAPPSTKPSTPAGPQPLVALGQTSHPESASRARRKALPWSELLRRVFCIDVLVCPKCLGPLTVIAYLTDPAVVGKILAHLGLPTSPPRLSPARLAAQVELFEDDLPVDRPCSARPRGGRAPPSRQADRPPLDRDDAADTFDWGA